MLLDFTFSLRNIWIFIVVYIILVNVKGKEDENVLYLEGKENLQTSTLLQTEQTGLLRKKKYYKGCKDGWLYFKNKCYKAKGYSSSAQRNWDDALKRCSSLNGNLVSINSQEEQDFIYIYILLILQKTMWIGLNDKQNDSVLTWSDQSTFQYANWAQGEPSGVGYRDAKEDCTEIYYNDDAIGLWNDASCELIRSYICEAEAVFLSTPPPDITKCTEPKGWTKFRNGCYKQFSGKNNLGSSWKEAEDICKEHGGHLVTIKDIQDQLFLKTLLRNYRHNMWIGLRNISNRFQWSSGNIVSFTKWSEISEGHCVVRDHEGKWETWECSNKFHFICEVLLDPVIPKSPGYCPQQPPDWIDLGTDYCYYFPRDKFVTWGNGQLDCMLRGGNLVVIHSEEERDLLNKLTLGYSEWRAIAIGMYRDPKGVFKWVDGSPITFEYWYPGEPNNKEERCVEMRGIGNRQWNDRNCSENFGYICGISKVFPVQNTQERKYVGMPDLTFVGLICAFLLFLVLIIITSLYILRPAENDRKVIIASKGHPQGMNPTKDDYF